MSCNSEHALCRTLARVISRRYAARLAEVAADRRRIVGDGTFNFDLALGTDYAWAMASYDDLIFRRRPSAASQALLSAALGGLLSLSTSCQSGDDDSDGGVAVDAGGLDDAGGSRDARVADATTPVDASGAEDAGAMVDAHVAMDGSEPMDATTPLDGGEGFDASASLDASVRDAWCDVDPVRTVTSTTIVADLTLEDFTTMCEGLGGFIEIHPHCGGMNSCRGVSYDSGTDELIEHTCAGLNTCTGFSCVTG